MKWVHELAAHMNQQAYGRLYFNREKQKFAYAKVDEPPTPALIDKHLSNESPVGLYTMLNPGSGDATGHVVIFDLDNHGGNLPEEFMQAIAARICDGLEDVELSYEIVRSGGGNGYHIWIVFENARRVDVLRKFGKDVLDWLNKAGVRHPTKRDENGKLLLLRISEGDGGLEKGQIEIFPKNAGWNLVALPCARKSVRLRRDGSKLVEASNDDALAVNKNKKPGPKAKAEDRDAAFDAIVQNGKLKNPGGDSSSPIDPSSHHHWTSFGHMLIAAFGKDDPWAFERWCAWAMSAPNADPREGQEKKWGKLNRDPNYAPATFWLCARDAGYTGKMPLTKKDEEKASILDLVANLPKWRSKEDRAFVTVATRHHIEVRSLAFDEWLRRHALQEQGLPLSAECVHLVKETVAAVAKAGEQHEVYLRVARVGDCTYLDLCNDALTVLVIDRDGWRVCEEPPVRFRKSAQHALPVPVPGGSIDELRRFVNLDDDQFVFLVAVIVKWLMSDTASPICNMTGEYGSAKTTAMLVMRALIDPASAMTAGPPKSEEDLVVNAYHNYVVSIDNARSFEKLSDAYCRLCTGGGLVTRRLYTNGDMFHLDVKRPIIVNGIDATAYQADLLSRMVTLCFDPIDNTMSEKEFWDRFHVAHARLLGALLDFAVTVLKKLDDTPTEGLPRLADFARVGETVARLLGKEEGWFISTYKDQIEMAQDDAADSDPVVTLLEFFCRNKYKTWKGLPKTLLIELETCALERTMSPRAMARMPQTPSNLGQRLKMNARILRRRGITIDRQGRELVITATIEDPVPF